MFVRAAGAVCVLVLAAVLVPSEANAATIVRVTAAGAGSFDIELNDNTPLHRDNFLQYVNAGRYTNAIFHRSDNYYDVLQTGGYTPPADPLNYFVDLITTFAPVPYEGAQGWSNTLGTVGAARSTDPDSATSQWYINMTDNSSLFDDQPGTPGYTVFGRVVSGWDVVQALFAIPKWDFTTVLPGSPFDWLPLWPPYDGTYWPEASDFVTIQSAEVVTVPEPATLALVAVGGLALVRRRGRKQ